MDNAQRKTYVKSMLTSSARDINSKMDMLWNKGKADNWPKEIMNYIMWIEHEMCRIPERLTQTAKVVDEIEVV